MICPMCHRDRPSDLSGKDIPTKGMCRYCWLAKQMGVPLLTTEDDTDDD